MASKQFVVIGLGRFGKSIAKTLYSLGNDVLAIDSSEDIVQEMADSVTHAVQADVTDENSLKSLGIRNFDVAVIAIGSDIQSSIMATLLAKEMGVKYVIAKAQNELHAKVLYKIGADRVVFPERDMASRVAYNLSSSNILDYIELSPDYSIVEITALPEWHGKSLDQLNFRKNYNISVMAIKHGKDFNVSPGAQDIINAQDVIVAIGRTESLERLEGSKTKIR